MSGMTPTQFIVMTTLPLSASLLSFTASMSILVMILRSVTKLSKPFRRIVFAMSFFDMIQSIASLSAPLMVPAGMNYISIGNHGTCAAQGFLHYLGSTGSPFYSLALAVFYVCIIKYDLRESIFRDRIEPFLHFIPNFFAWSSAVYLLSTGSLNFAGFGCWIAPYPANCYHNPDVDCIRGEKSFLYRWIFAGIPVFLCFFGCLLMMLVICRAVFTTPNNVGRRQSTSRLPDPTDRDSSLVPSYVLESTTSAAEPLPRSGTPASFAAAMAPAQQSIRMSMRNRNKQVVQQALLFILSFMTVFMFTYINRITEQITGSSPFWLKVLARTVLSLQGFMNTIVYTRPHVTSIRQRYPSYSWMRSFLTVVKLGGDYDSNDRRLMRRTRRAARDSPRQKTNNIQRGHDDPDHLRMSAPGQALEETLGSPDQEQRAEAVEASGRMSIGSSSYLNTMFDTIKGGETFSERRELGTALRQNIPEVDSRPEIISGFSDQDLEEQLISQDYSIPDSMHEDSSAEQQPTNQEIFLTNSSDKQSDVENE